MCMTDVGCGVAQGSSSVAESGPIAANMPRIASQRIRHHPAVADNRWRKRERDRSRCSCRYRRLLAVMKPTSSMRWCPGRPQHPPLVFPGSADAVGVGPPRFSRNQRAGPSRTIFRPVRHLPKPPCSMTTTGAATAIRQGCTGGTTGSGPPALMVCTTAAPCRTSSVQRSRERHSPRA